MTEKLEIKVQLQIMKPAHEVYEAIVDPAQMTHYFISQSSGMMEEGKTLIWRFPEFDIEFPVYVGKMVRDSYISFQWDIDNERLLVEISLAPAGDQATVLTITEKSRENNEAGIEWLRQNTGGWANFLACLKAWLEFGINLRKGSFDFMINK